MLQKLETHQGAMKDNINLIDMDFIVSFECFMSKSKYEILYYA